MDNYLELDAHSVSQTLKVMSYYQYQHREHLYKPTTEQLKRIEAKIH